MGGNGQHGETTAAFAVLRRTLDGIAAMEPSPEKTRAIRDLAEELQELYGIATAIRKAEVLRIQEAEKLTLAQLASRVGISKARADQIINGKRPRRKDVRNE
jgi:predicted DNA-binding protein (UPF0251 family)